MFRLNELVSTLERETELSQEMIEELVRKAHESGESLDHFILTRGIVTESKLLEMLSRCLKLEFLHRLNECEVPEAFVSRIPVQFARSHNLVAVGEQNSIVRIATAMPLDVHPLDQLASMLHKGVSPVLATRSEIASLINRAYQSKVDVVDEMLGDLREDEMESISRELERSTDLLDLANKAPIIKLVNMILFQSLKMRASDVHIQPYEEKLQIRYRIDGELHDVMTPPKKVQEAIISRVKVMGDMDIAERRFPQDGRATIQMGDSEVDVRISSVPTAHGERIVMRLLDKTARLLELEELGMPKEVAGRVTKLIQCPHGIILVTGPTGSGKTTTLYASLMKLNSTAHNIITIEDPIEYQLSGVSQIEVATKKGLTFARGLRSIVRQDPDIIMVGEIRDLETAQIAIQSALTGHLVFSTLHTNDSASTVTRLLDLGVESYLVASSVIAVIAQRLVRLICPECKEQYEPEPSSLEQIGLSIEDFPGSKLWHGRGCAHCFNTGYLDRTGIYEVLEIDDLIREQVMNRVGANTIKKDAVRAGLRTLRMDGALKVLQGLTTIEEVIRITQMDIV